MSDSNDNQSALPMPVILAAVAIVILIIVAIFAFGGDDPEVTDETTDETTEQTSPAETDGSADADSSDGQTPDDGAATPDPGDPLTPPETPPADDTETTAEPSPLPANWATLSATEKTDLNPYGCWQGTIIRADNGQCSIGGGSNAGYFLMGGQGPQAYTPFQQVAAEVHVAMPTSSTAAQIGEVLESFKASVADSPDTLFIFHVYNYSDISYDPDAAVGTIPWGWVITGGPRETHEFVLTNIRYKYLFGDTVVYRETGRTGADLPENCIAVDLAFAILSDVTAQEVVNYYINQGSALRLALDSLVLGAEATRVEGSATNYNVLIRLYKGDDPAVDTYGEADLFTGLPQVALNGCANPELF